MKSIITRAMCIVLCAVLSGCITSIDESLPYARIPDITVATEVRLIASPSHPTAYLAIDPILAGDKVQVIGTDKNAAWLLVRHKDRLGWMPTIFSRTNVATLPAAVTLDPVPSECVYLGSLFALDETWINPMTGGAIVVGSLYRSAVGDDFAEAKLQLTIDGDGQVVEGDYVHTALTDENALILFGFSLTGLAKGSTLSFVLADAGQEPLDFVVSIFSSECQGARLTDLLPIGLPKTITTPVQESAGESEDASPTTITVTNGRLQLPPVRPGNKALEPEGEVRPLGALWEADDMTLNLTRLEIRTEGDGESAALQAWFVLFNNTGQRLLVEIDWTNIYFEDSFGTRYVDWEGGGVTSRWIDAGQSYAFNRYYTIEPGRRGRVPASAEYVQGIVTEFSRVKNARWQFDIHPTLTPLTPEEFGEVKEVGEIWDADGLRLRVTKTEIRAASDSESGAARVWFTLENTTNNRILVELDFGRIYLTDSFGRRFNDWDGGGFWSFSLDPGQSQSFNRYYSEMSGVRSRITRGSEFVVIQAFNIGRIPRASWHVPIVR